MIVDGRKLADGILAELKKVIKKLPRRLGVGAVLVGENPASRPDIKSGRGSPTLRAAESFLKQKAKTAEFLGVDFKIFRYGSKIKTEELIKEILKISKKINGIIIQLPLPKHIKTDLVLNAISPEKDIDALSDSPLVLAPTVEAVKFIFEKYKLKSDFKNPRSRTSKKILIVGRGRLVGQPIFQWLSSQETSRTLVKQDLNQLKIINIKQKNLLPKLAREADIIISGVGKPGLIKGDIIKNGAVLIDFGFSRKNRKIGGDFDFASCAKKTKLITPVPGGMGPIMVVMLFRNLLKLNKK